MNQPCPMRNSTWPFITACQVIGVFDMQFRGWSAHMTTRTELLHLLLALGTPDPHCSVGIVRYPYLEGALHPQVLLLPLVELHLFELPLGYLLPLLERPYASRPIWFTCCDPLVAVCSLYALLVSRLLLLPLSSLRNPP
jgi:hypothetical protein